MIVISVDWATGTTSSPHSNTDNNRTFTMHNLWMVCLCHEISLMVITKCYQFIFKYLPSAATVTTYKGSVGLTAHIRASWDSNSQLCAYWARCSHCIVLLPSAGLIKREFKHLIRSKRSQSLTRDVKSSLTTKQSFEKPKQQDTGINLPTLYLQSKC